MRTPLAWLNLTHDKRRFVVSLAGIAFAVLLMFMQIGFLNALVDGTVEVIKYFDADYIIISKSKYTLSVNTPFPRTRLTQAMSVRGIEAHAMYVEYRSSLWKNIEESEPPRHIRVIAFDPGQPLLLIPEVLQHARELEMPNTAMIDRKSKRDFAPEEKLARELASHSIQVVGTFEIGTDFANDGNLVISDRNYAKFFPISDNPDDVLREVEVGLLRQTIEAEPEAMRAALIAALPNDVQVLTLNEFIDLEKSFWLTHAPIGFVFGLGTAIGFIVGMVICYQVLSSDVADHLSEYATLKAIGYHNASLNAVVLQEALWLSLLGFIPGVIASRLLYEMLEQMTGLPLCLSWSRGALVLALTVLMCIGSGFLALRKVKSADPAEVF